MSYTSRVTIVFLPTHFVMFLNTCSSSFYGNSLITLWSTFFVSLKNFLQYNYGSFCFSYSSIHWLNSQIQINLSDRNSHRDSKKRPFSDKLERLNKSKRVDILTLLFYFQFNLLHLLRILSQNVYQPWFHKTRGTYHRREFLGNFPEISLGTSYH